MNKYFRVQMDAARAIVDSSEGPELLAGYIVMNRFAMPPKYGFTAAGARVIRDSAGISDCRAKLVLRNLLALRFGERGERFLIEDTGKMMRNARKYEIGQWGGLVSYLPDLMVQGDPTPLSRLVRADAAPEVRRDAMLMLLHIHAAVDYAEWLGVDPAEFIYKKWALEGFAGMGDDEVELGHAGEEGGLHYWLAREEPEGPRFTLTRNAERIYGSDNMDRFWAAHDLLRVQGLLCCVAVVCTGGTSYPLWVFSPAYREALERTGVRADLARLIQNAASRTGIDPDNRVIATATGPDRENYGTEVFFVVTKTGKAPTIRTIYAPLFHAPTPLNLAGLAEMAERTKEWTRRLEYARQANAA